jgi:hypothetical protein
MCKQKVWEKLPFVSTGNLLALEEGSEKNVPRPVRNERETGGIRGKWP